MNEDPLKRQVRIVDSKTGKERLSEPVAVHVALTEPSEESDPSSGGDTAETDGAAARLLAPAEPAKALESQRRTSEPRIEPRPYQAGGQPRVAKPGVQRSGERESTPSKPKADITTLEQYIRHAYESKGRRLSLKSKTERLIAQSPRLDEGAQYRLAALASGDTLLAVPRQLLLVSMEVTGYPALRAALVGFVSAAVLRHPVYSDASVQAVIRNLPDAPVAARAFGIVANYQPPSDGGDKALKNAELQVLRRNAAQLLVVWLAISRGMGIDELTSLLFQTQWKSAALALGDDSSRLRALTDLEEPAAAGLACQRFVQQAVDSHATMDQALRDAASLRSQVAELESHRALAEAERDSARADLEAYRESAEARLSELQDQHRVAMTHAEHALEQLRGRLLRRIGDAIDTLEVGLTALRKEPPRTEVMLERAEHVVDALRVELKNL